MIFLYVLYFRESCNGGEGYWEKTAGAGEQDARAARPPARNRPREGTSLEKFTRKGKSTLGYSDFNYLKGVASKKLPNNILKTVCQKRF